MQAIVIFSFHSTHLCNHVGPFDNVKEAEVFMHQWRQRGGADVKDIRVVRLDTPRTPEQCRSPAEPRC